MTEALLEVRKLVERFKEHREEYLSGAYKEEQVCAEFILPMFEALGWDISNKQGSSEAYKEVIHHDSIKSGVGTEAPDYCFRIGGVRKFFLEAKKPSVNIKDDLHPAYQLRRYAWSAKLPLGILTDFEEFIVYDCRAKPAKTDKASTARILYLTHDQFLDRWDEIAGVFSKDAILKGSFDKYATAMKGKRGTASVDDAFLEEIERWRKLLAQNVAQHNRKLGVRELNFAVQTIIDRIIFLRICEDQGFESYGQLMVLQNGQHAYDRLVEIFRNADRRYNSGLFHFDEEKGRPTPPDTLTPHLKIDDDVLRDIFKNLYYPQSPYEFSVLPTEILGQVYERFLGKIIHLTPTRQAKIEEKPEVRKAGGVYYTPSYIVDYIVKNTVGKLLEGKTPNEASRLRILDPACGSGSFLIGAYQLLLKWHLDWYVNHDPAKWAGGKRPTLFRDKNGHWGLTIDEQRRILTDNIYGVDIDPQAVEVTKLSLLLKLLESRRQGEMFREHALPDLGANIKCGNSLIGPDFYEGKQMSLLGDDERARINIFDWHQEFAPIMKAGGFNAVIGNPPYVRQESLSDLKQYFETHYEAFDGVADLYTYFMEQGVKLLRDGGLFSIIVSSSFLRASYGEPLRRTLKKHAAVLRIVDFGGLAVFANAKDTYVCIPLLQKGGKQARVEIAKLNSLEFINLNDYVSQHHFTIPSERLSAEAWALKSDDEATVFAKIMKTGKPLGEYVARSFFRGVTTGLNDAFIIDDATRNQLIKQDKKSAELIKPLLGGEDIRRYVFNETSMWLIFTRRGVDIDRYPAIRNHLARRREYLTPKRDKSTKKGRKPGRYAWYEIQDDVAYYEVFDRPKILYPDIAKGPRFCLDLDRHYVANTVYCLGTDDRYLLGVLNSRLFWFVISNISIPFGIRAGQYRYRLIYQYMEKVPIHVLDLSNVSDRTMYDRMVSLVEQMLGLNRQLVSVRTPQDKTALDRQIAATDRQIDQLVYELYGLTEEEIRIVERG